MLNKILMSWTESSDATTDAQFGFRSSHSTVKAICALQTIVNK